MTRRFYAPAGWDEGEARLEDGESHHLLHVLRAEPGFAVEVFDGRGGRGIGVLAGRDGKRAVVRIESTTTEPADPEFVLATAVPKGDRFAWLVEKATELGVSRLVPLVTRRSVVDPGAGKLDKLGRLFCRHGTPPELCAELGEGRGCADVVAGRGGRAGNKAVTDGLNRHRLLRQVEGDLLDGLYATR